MGQGGISGVRMRNWGEGGGVMGQGGRDYGAGGD